MSNICVLLIKHVSITLFYSLLLCLTYAYCRFGLIILKSNVSVIPNGEFYVITNPGEVFATAQGQKKAIRRQPLQAKAVTTAKKVSTIIGGSLIELFFFYVGCI